MSNHTYAIKLPEPLIHMITELVEECQQPENFSWLKQNAIEHLKYEEDLSVQERAEICDQVEECEQLSQLYDAIPAHLHESVIKGVYVTAERVETWLKEIRAMKPDTIKHIEGMFGLEQPNNGATDAHKGNV